MIPYSLLSSLMSAVSGMYISRTGSWRPIMWISWAIMTLGYGLLTMLDDTSNSWVMSLAIAERLLIVCIQCGADSLPAGRRPWYRFLVPGVFLSLLSVQHACNV